MSSQPYTASSLQVGIETRLYNIEQHPELKPVFNPKILHILRDLLEIANQHGSLPEDRRNAVEGTAIRMLHERLENALREERTIALVDACNAINALPKRRV